MHLFLISNKIDWINFYHLCAIHRVRPLVYHVLSQFIEDIPPAPLNELKKYSMYFNAFALANKRELDRILNLLLNNNIYGKSFKGLDFAQNIFGHTGIREFSDNDIIINESAIEKVIGIMTNEGYHSKDIVFYNRFPKEYVRDYKDLLFEKMNGPVREFAFEFHFKPARYFQGYPFTFEQVLGKDHLSASRQLDETDYVTLITLSNGLMDVYPNIRSVLDLAVIFKRKDEIALPEVNNILHAYINIGMLLSHGLFDFPVFNPLEKKTLRIADKVLEKILNVQAPSRIPLFQYLVLNFKISHFRGKIKLLMAHFLLVIRPSLQDICAISLKRYSFYYFLKPFRIFTKFYQRK